MMMDIPSRTVRAQELYGDYWFKSEPIPLLALRGQVVLLDFWDLTSAPSLRWIPYLLLWQEKYGPSGLVIIGIHTPRVEFAADPERVRAAIERYGITYPVVTDNGALLWSRYNNRQWPTKHLIDRDGFVRFQNTGDGHVLATEHALQTFMYEAGLLEDLPALVAPRRAVDQPGAVLSRSTPEIFAGYTRGSLGNVEGEVPESTTHYSDPGVYLDGRVYVAGDWFSSRTHLTLSGDSTGALVAAAYTGQGAGAVLGMTGRETADITVLQDNSFLDEATRGTDVRLAADGRSFLRVAEPRYYDLLRNRDVGEHILRLTGLPTGLSVYVLAFEPGIVPELAEEGDHG